ncbi:MAG: hypothetical protein P4L69_17645 [Desulfosporosinus sp.]|nr:hypothetical protein [Desulfosporosinus sp.]
MEYKDHPGRCPPNAMAVEHLPKEALGFQFLDLNLRQICDLEFLLCGGFVSLSFLWDDL